MTDPTESLNPQPRQNGKTSGSARWRALREEALRSRLEPTTPVITIPTPRMTHAGPEDTTAQVLRRAASKLAAGYAPGGSNVRELVIRTIMDAATALDQAAIPSAPPSAGVGVVFCAHCPKVITSATQETALQKADALGWGSVGGRIYCIECGPSFWKE